jgi:hypothetical protein
MPSSSATSRWAQGIASGGLGITTTAATMRTATHSRPALHAQDIAAGELLTTNYLGYDIKTLLSTPMRQQRLADKFLFRCRCHR